MVPISYVRLIDDESMEIIDSYKLAQNEGCGSLISCKFKDDDNEYYAVGATEVKEDEPEPTRGRILVFQIVNKKLVLRASRKVNGAVYSLASFRGGLLAGISSTLLLLTYTSTRDEGKLTIECGCHSHVAVLLIRSYGDFILTGDLVQSLSVFQYKESGYQKQIELMANDDNPAWLSAAEMLDLDNFLGAQSSCYNLFLCQRNADATDEEHAKHLLPAGGFHLGELVNQFRFGSLAMQLPVGRGK